MEGPWRAPSDPSDAAKPTLVPEMSVDFLTPAEAALRIEDGSTVAVAGAGGGLLESEAVCAAIEARFLATGHPRDLTLVNALGFGDAAHIRGINHFAHEGMLRRAVVGLWSWSPKMQDMAASGAVEAYCLPGGAIMQLLREIGAGRPGLFTHVGLGTFVDPRQGGGKCNARATADIVELMTIDGREVLRYKPFRVDVGIVRGTCSDPRGNISTIEEPADLDASAVATAAHASRGLVIAQVRERVAARSLPPRDVRVPGVLVDAVVVDPGQMQTHRARYEPELSGQARAALKVIWATLLTNLRTLPGAWMRNFPSAASALNPLASKVPQKTTFLAFCEMSMKPPVPTSRPPRKETLTLPAASASPMPRQVMSMPPPE